MQKPPPQQTVGAKKPCQRNGYRYRLVKKTSSPDRKILIERKKHRKEQASTVILDIEINNADHHSQKQKTHTQSLSLSLSLFPSRARTELVCPWGRRPRSRGRFQKPISRGRPYEILKPLISVIETSVCRACCIFFNGDISPKREKKINFNFKNELILEVFNLLETIEKNHEISILGFNLLPKT
jgi:hypothetical protein